MIAPQPSPDHDDDCTPTTPPRRKPRTRGNHHRRLGGRQDIEGLPLPRPAKSGFRPIRVLRNIRPGEAPPPVSPSPHISPEERLVELQRAFADVLRREATDAHAAVSGLISKLSGRPIKSRIVELFIGHGHPPAQAKAFAAETIFLFEQHEARMAPDPAEDIPAPQDMIAAAGELSRTIESLRSASRDDPEFERLRRCVVAQATSVARIAVNIVIIGGRSLSSLPDEIDLDRSEGSALALAARVARIANDDPIVLAELKADNPLHGLITAISSFEAGGSEVVLGIRAALASIAFDGSHLCGLTSLMNLASMSRGAIGERAFVAVLADVAERLGRLDPAIEDPIVHEFPALRLMPTAEAAFACYLTAASFHAKFAIEAEGDSAASTGQMREDFRSMCRLVELARGLSKGLETEFTLLRAEQVALAERLGVDPPAEARGFWEAMSADEATRVVQQIADFENVPALVVAVRDSARRVHPSLAPFRVQA